MRGKEREEREKGGREEMGKTGRMNSGGRRRKEG